MCRNIRVTDHALIRYLERVKGLAFEALRHDLETKIQNGSLGSAVEPFRGSKYKAIMDRVERVVSRDSAVTCYPQ